MNVLKKLWCTHTHTHTHTQSLSHEKEENPAICENKDRCGGHYANGDKSYRERQTQYDVT